VTVDICTVPNIRPTARSRGQTSNIHIVFQSSNLQSLRAKRRLRHRFPSSGTLVASSPTGAGGIYHGRARTTRIPAWACKKREKTNRNLVPSANQRFPHQNIPVTVEVTVHPLVGPHLEVHGPQKSLLDWSVGTKYEKQEPGTDMVVGSVTGTEK
jgi:hypothetical protein